MLTPSNENTEDGWLVIAPSGCAELKQRIRLILLVCSVISSFRVSDFLVVQLFRLQLAEPRDVSHGTTTTVVSAVGLSQLQSLYIYIAIQSLLEQADRQPFMLHFFDTREVIKSYRVLPVNSEFSTKQRPIDKDKIAKSINL